MPDTQTVQNNKEKILSVISSKGPSFPARISRETGITPLFVSAFLAELASEKKLKISDMKVGSSPIYYIQGQEKNLEEFAEYLNSKEKEAFFALKNSQILSDEEQPPALRVALRKLKDFANPVNVRIGGETKLFWKYFLVPDTETKNLIEKLLNPEEKNKPIKTITPEQKTPEEKHESAEKETKKTEKSTQEKEEKTPVAEKSKEEKPKQKKQQKPKESKFANNVKDYLEAKDIEILEEILVKKNEFIAKIRIDTPFGKQEYLLTAKDKKKISEDDLALAVHKAQTEKMPSLFLSKGSLDKNAQPYLENWKNLVKFEKIKF